MGKKNADAASDAYNDITAFPVIPFHTYCYLERGGIITADLLHLNFNPYGMAWDCNYADLQ